MFIFDAVFWAVGIAIVILLGVLRYLTPALFQLCVWAGWHAAEAAEQITGVQLSHGMLILVSLGLWGGAGALSGALLFPVWMGSTPAVALGIVGALWGAASGHQVGLQRQMLVLRRPGALPHTTPGQTWHVAPESWEEPKEEGVPLGFRGWPE